MTTSTDNITRIWTQDMFSKRIHFHMSVILDPSHYNLVSEEVKGQSLNIVHWFNISDTKKAIHAQEEAERAFLKQKNTTQHVRSNKRLKDLLKDYNDVIFTVTTEGSIAFWGVQVLGQLFLIVIELIYRICLVPRPRYLELFC